MSLPDAPSVGVYKGPNRGGEDDEDEEEAKDEIKDEMQPIDTNETEGEENDLDQVIVPNTGSSGGSFSGPHHRKFVCSSSGGVTKFIRASEKGKSDLEDVKVEISKSL